MPTNRAAATAILEGPSSTDGRIARGERTRQHVADALISLLEDGGPLPTAKAVAERAEISLRLVFHHFADMDALYRAAIVLQARRHWSALRAVPPGLPLAQRIDRTVRQRSRLFEAIGPVRRVAVLHACHSADLANALAESSSLLREHLTGTFGPELDAAGAGDLLEAIDAGASWETWERLRLGQHLTPTAARRVVARTLAGLLGPIPPTGHTPAGATKGTHRTRR